MLSLNSLLEIIENQIKHESLKEYNLAQERIGNTCIVSDLFHRLFLYNELDQESKITILLETLESAYFQSFFSSLDKKQVETFLENFKGFSDDFKRVLSNKIKDFSFLEKTKDITILKDSYKYFFEENSSTSFQDEIGNLLELSYYYKRNKDDFFQCEDCLTWMDNQSGIEEIYFFGQESFFCEECAKKEDNLYIELESISKELKRDLLGFCGSFSLILEIVKNNYNNENSLIYFKEYTGKLEKKLDDYREKITVLEKEKEEYSSFIIVKNKIDSLEKENKELKKELEDLKEDIEMERSFEREERNN